MKMDQQTLKEQMGVTGVQLTEARNAALLCDQVPNYKASFDNACIQIAALKKIVSDQYAELKHKDITIQKLAEKNQRRKDMLNQLLSKKQEAESKPKINPLDVFDGHKVGGRYLIDASRAAINNGYTKLLWNARVYERGSGTIDWVDIGTRQELLGEY